MLWIVKSLTPEMIGLVAWFGELKVYNPRNNPPAQGAAIL
jgi:hypothetical protein